MRQQLIYDLPTRIFHWFFSVFFLCAFIIAKTIEDDSPIYPYHMMIGLSLGFLVFLRIVWGVIGTKHAKFSDFALRPKDLISYLKGTLSGDKRKWSGHNPASSWAALTMFIFIIGLGITGYLMTTGPNKENFEDIHELFANGMIILVVLHISGIAFHTFRHKDMIGLSMLDGKKEGPTENDVITSTKPFAGLFLIAAIASFAIFIFKNYNSANKSLNIFSTTLQLGETEDKEIQKQNNENNPTSKQDDDE